MAYAVSTHVTVIYHDPIGRFELVRRSIYGTMEGCAWCGNFRTRNNRKQKVRGLFQYGVRNDDNLRGTIDWDKRYFCSRDCRKNFRG